MRSWESLTKMGQIRRLRALALQALEDYPLDVRSLRLIGDYTNILFRIDAPSGPAALRVDFYQEHSDEDVEIELAWLGAIAGDTDLDVVRPVPTQDGRLFTHASAPGVPGKRRCTLFEWVPGRPLDEKPTESGYHRLGRLSAGLHLHGAQFIPPHRPMRWDKVFYWPEEVDPVVIFKPEMAQYFPGDRTEMIARGIAASDRALARLQPGSAQLIHGDLHPGNVHTYRSRLIAFDFEDVMWGHAVQDVAITLYYGRDHPGYVDFRAAFEDGYRSVAEWPVTYDGELEHFMAARTLMFINYVANIERDPSAFYDIAFPRLEQFLDIWGD